MFCPDGRRRAPPPSALLLVTTLIYVQLSVLYLHFWCRFSSVVACVALWLFLAGKIGIFPKIEHSFGSEVWFRCSLSDCFLFVLSTSEPKSMKRVIVDEYNVIAF